MSRVKYTEEQLAEARPPFGIPRGSTIKEDGWTYADRPEMGAYRRAKARLNYALRKGSTDDPLTQQYLSQFDDFGRDVLAGHLLASLEDEFGKPVEE